MRRLSIFFFAFVLFAVSVMFSACVPKLANKQLPDPKNAQEMISRTIDLLELHWENSSDVDWDSVREEYWARAQTLTTPRESYPLIREIIATYTDSWTYLHLSGVGPGDPIDKSGFKVLLPDWQIVAVNKGSSAAQAGLQIGDRIYSIDGVVPAKKISFLAPKQPGAKAAYETCRYRKTEYCALLQRIYLNGTWLEISRQGRKDNFFATVEGHNQGRAIQSNGARLGKIAYLEIVADNSNKTAYLEKIEALLAEQSRTETCALIIDFRRNYGGSIEFVNALKPATERQKEDLAIAVLAGPLSNGLAVRSLMKIKQFNRAKFFGEQTGGRNPKTKLFHLYKEADLVITEHSGSVFPDEYVKTDWALYQGENDPVILAAKNWLNEQTSCRK